jgi:hypothetical protein
MSPPLTRGLKSGTDTEVCYRVLEGKSSVEGKNGWPRNGRQEVMRSLVLQEEKQEANELKKHEPEGELRAWKSRFGRLVMEALLLAD